MTSLRLSIVALCIIATSSIGVVSARADTLRVMTYNGLNFRGDEDSDRIDDFRIVIGFVQPDVVAMQEIISEDAVDYLLSFAYLPNNDDWASATFMDGPDTDNALFYRTSKATLVSQREIINSPRYVNEYILRPAAVDTSLRFRLYSAHLKAGDSESDQQRRQQEATNLRQQYNQLPSGSLFMMMGDFNLYTSEETSYQTLLSMSPNPNGQLFDPINQPGAWHSSVSFAAIHTQSPRTQSFGGGATGGLDDRFDFILVSAAFMDTVGSYVIPSTYWPVGNDGNHFNQAINNGFNSSVPDSVADALHYAADHLPVVANFVIRPDASDAAWNPPIAASPQLVHCYPNPFNGRLRVDLGNLRGPLSLDVFDVLGRRVQQQRIVNALSGSVNLNFDGVATGTYHIRVEGTDFSQVVRVNLVR